MHLPRDRHHALAAPLGARHPGPLDISHAYNDSGSLRAAVDVTNRGDTPIRRHRMCRSLNTTPVGKYEAGKSGYGCYDMAGNLWDWCDTKITATNGS